MATCSVAALILVCYTTLVAKIIAFQKAGDQRDDIVVTLPVEERQHRASATDIHSGQSIVLGENLSYIIML